MVNRITYDPEKFNLDVARIKKQGVVFEIAVDSEAAIAFKEGSLKEISDVIKSEKVFSDVQRGLLAPENKFDSSFGTSDFLKIAEIILKEGEVHLTAEHRKKEIDRKRNQILHIIHRNGVDPKTNFPHPIPRLETAFDEAKVHIDEFKIAEEQVSGILKKLQVILPIKFEVKEIEFNILPQYSHSAYSYIKKVGKVLRQNWAPDQSLSGVVEIPGGLEEEFHEQLNKLTKGSIFTKILKIR